MYKIVVLGGGTAGWLTASYLSSRLRLQERAGVEISLIEASDIPTIGVGEATVPSIRATLSALGVSEYAFMKACNATFKHGIRFTQWCQPADKAAGEYYFHPFERPLAAGLDNIGGHWLRGVDPLKRHFGDAVSIQQALSAGHFAPKRFEDPSYSGPLPYAYHLDAGKLAQLLTQIGVQKGVKHIIGKVQGISAGADGTIKSLQLDENRQIEGDVFIDCSGFSALLIDGHYKRGFTDLSNTLFCDRAVTCQVPEDNPETYDIRPYTLSTAQSEGWIWDIGLSNRRGTGYVYSSNYLDKDNAETVLRNYIGSRADQLNTRHLSMRVGYRTQQWHKNCVAIGLSAGFIEPLESTGIHFVELAIAMLVQMLPRFFRGGRPQARFNEIMFNQYQSAIDFIKLHYFLSSRRDSAFWIDNTSENSLSDDLLEKVTAWRYGYPDVYDLRFVHSIFDHSSYQYILFGMNKGIAIDDALSDCNTRAAVARFNDVTMALQKAKDLLPSHNQIIQKIAMS